MNLHLGILGGGQLGRMIALAAHSLGVRVSFVDPSAEAPAAAVATHYQNDYEDGQLVNRLAEADVVTFEFENVPEQVARQLSAAKPVYPSAEALRVAQDRLIEKDTFRRLGIGTTRYCPISSSEDVANAFSQLGPLVLKTRRFGYDGKGQVVVKSAEEAITAHEKIGRVAAIAEELVPFDRELSVIICRGRDGKSVVYPVVENTHEQGILRKSVAPAPQISTETTQRARHMAETLTEELDYVGVLALELFDVGGRLLANEFAPRVHNSGHSTIEGARTSQFENHVRAVLGLPLGSAAPLEHSVMLNLIGEVPSAHALLSIEDCHLHDYGKKPRAARKVGHVTVRGETTELAAQRASLVERTIAAKTAQHQVPANPTDPNQ